MSRVGTCARCGKEFFVPYEKWGYAYDGAECCSHSCVMALRAADVEARQVRQQLENVSLMDEVKQQEEVRAMRYKRLTEEDRQRIRDMAERGMGKAAIAREMGCSDTAVNNALRAAPQEAKNEEEAMIEKNVQVVCHTEPERLELLQSQCTPEPLKEIDTLAAIVETVRTLSQTLSVLARMLEMVKP